MDIDQRVPWKAGAPLPQLIQNLPTSSTMAPGNRHSARNRYEEKQVQIINLQAPRQLPGIANAEGVEECLKIRSKCLLRRPRKIK